jgi:hypothetical protein
MNIPKVIVAKVYCDYEDGEYGPDYVAIRLNGDPAGLAEKLAATEEIAQRFIGDALARTTGAVQAVKFWLRDLPLEVTWLRSSAMCDEDGCEPDWVYDELEGSEGFVLLDEFEPNLGEPDEDHFGDHENEFATVDLESAYLMPNRKFELQANVDSCGMPFSTSELPLDALLD